MSQRGKHTKVWIGGYHLTTRISDAKPSAMFDEVEASGYEQDKNYMKGQADSAISIDGYFNKATGSTHEALKTLNGDSGVIVSLALGNNTAPVLGDVTVSLFAEQTNYQPSSDKAGAIGVHADFKSRGYSLEFGRLLANATVTANGQQSSVDNTASSANGGVGFLHILGLSAGDTITVKIQHSSNNSTWADLITFTMNGSVIGAERIAVAGTINRYVRASYTVTGSGISFPIVVIFVRK